MGAHGGMDTRGKWGHAYRNGTRRARADAALNSIDAPRLCALGLSFDRAHLPAWGSGGGTRGPGIHGIIPRPFVVLLPFVCPIASGRVRPVAVPGHCRVFSVLVRLHGIWAGDQLGLVVREGADRATITTALLMESAHLRLLVLGLVGRALAVLGIGPHFLCALVIMPASIVAPAT